jgi:hypothetical protein
VRACGWTWTVQAAVCGRLCHATTPIPAARASPANAASAISAMRGSTPIACTIGPSEVAAMPADFEARRVERAARNADKREQARRLHAAAMARCAAETGADASGQFRIAASAHWLWEDPPSVVFG